VVGSWNIEFSLTLPLGYDCARSPNHQEELRDSADCSWFVRLLASKTGELAERRRGSAIAEIGLFLRGVAVRLSAI